MRVHLDTDFLVYAVATRGPERRRLTELSDSNAPFSEELATIAAEVFRNLGSPRRRAADVAVGVTAASMEALLLSRNAGDFAGIPNLQVESPFR